MAAELQGIIHTEVPRIQKAKWLSVYVRACAKAFSPSNILFAFSVARINPDNPEKVIGRIRRIENSQLLSSESEPENPLPLNPSLIPSFPVDVATFKTARTALSEYMHENPAFSTPVKTFIDRYTKNVDRLWAHNTIVENQV